MTRLITCLVLGLMAVLTSLQAQTPTFSVDPATINADPGDQFSVDIRVSNFVDLISFEYEMKWDDSVLRLDETSNFTDAIDGFGSSQVNASRPNLLVVSWFDNSISANTLEDGTVLYRMTFTALAGGTTAIEFTEDSRAFEVLTIEEENVGLNPVNATATVSGDDGGGDGGGGDGGGDGGGGTNDDPVTISAGSANGQSGSEVCVPVQVTGFTDITKFQFSINYDNAVIEYSRAQTFGIPNLSAAQFSTPSAGNVVLNYENAAGVSIADNATAFELCYNLVGSGNTSSNISFSGTPTVIDVQRSGTNIALNSTAGNISIDADTGGGGGDGGGDGGGGMGNGDNPLSVIVGTGQGGVGDNVCVPISVVDFVGIVSFQYSINYPANVLSYTGVQNFNLESLNDNAFNDDGNGSISVSWLDNTLDGITLDNNTTIVELCFDIIAGGTANISITNTPLSIEVTDESQEDIGLTPTNGQITASGNGGGDGGGGDGGGGNGGGDGGGNGGGGNGGGGDGTEDCANATGFTFVASDVNTEPGNNFCVDIVANDFEDIVSFQTSMNWDPSVIQFTGIQNFGLPDFGEGNFGTQDTNQGELSVSWLEQTTQGASINDCDDIIVTVCFTAIGNEGECTDFTFGEGKTPIEVIDTAEMEVSVNTDSGTICLVGEPVSNIIFNASDVTTDEGAAFCIPVTVEGFMNIANLQYDMQFDAGLLQFDRVEVTNNVLPNFSSANFNAGNGSVAVNWSNASGVDVPDNTVLYNICFNAIGAGSTNVSFANDNVTNGSGQTLPFVGNRSNINIANSEPITPIAVGDTFFPNTGDQRCAVVTAQNFDDISAFQYGMMWDDALFRYENVNILAGGQQIGLDLASFGYNPDRPDVLAISWMDDNFNGNNIPNGTPIYEVCFTALGSVGSRSPFVYSDMPVPEVIDGNTMEANFNGGTGFLIIGEATQDLNFTADVTDASGPNANDGSISLNVINCNTTPTYVWSAPLQNETGSSVSGLAPGNYTVTVRCGDQSVTQTFTVNTAAQLVVEAFVNNASCVNFTDGEITLNTTGGTEPYTYTWSDIGEGSAFRFGLTAGDYMVTVQDNNGVQTVETITVGGNTTALELQVNSVSNASCSNTSDGGVNITINGGTPDYMVQWSDDPNETMATRDDLAPDTYVVTITDANGCSEDESFNIGSENAGIEITNVQVTPVSDNIAGAITVDVSGGTGTFTYVWTGPNGFMETTEDINGLQIAGEYTLTVTDAENGCTNTITRSVNSPLGITADITSVCFGETTGSIDITPFGGSGEGYTFMWTGSNFSETTEDIMNVSAGTYTVRVTDSDGGEITQTYQISEGAQINATADIQNEVGATGSANGSITITATGGEGDFTYIWSDPITSTTNVASGLTTGNYSVTITDELGCTQVLNNLIIENEPADLMVEAEGVNTSCTEGEDGSLIITITGGQFPYTITINGNDTIVNQTEVIIENLPSGTYAIQVTSNAGGEPINLTESVISPMPIIATSATIFNPTDPEVCNGGINLSLSGGTEPYEVNWMGPNGYQGFTESITGICIGEYTATITDANGCTTTLDPITVNLFEIDTEATAISNPPCPESETGLIVPAISGGQEDFSYVWMDENGDTMATTRNLENVPPGTYILEVTDANQRSVSATFTLEPTSDLALETNVLTNFNGFAVSCADATDATLQAVGTSSAGIMNYQWSTGESTQSIAVGEGSYSVTATDSDGCTAIAELSVAAPSAIEVAFSTNPITCAGEADGEITAMVTGGVPNYSFLWNNQNSSTNATIFGLGAGNYTVQITDANGCTMTANQDITTVDPIELSAEVTNIEINQPGSATITPTGGTPPYTYTWDSGVTEPTFTTAKEGKYTVIVEDANRCIADTTVEIIFIVDCFIGRPVITPDGDGLNDEFIINCMFQADDNNLRIFNRWGQLVFEQSDYDNTWMGTNTRGSALPEGAYFWVLEYRDEDGAPQQVKGSLTIVTE